MKFLAIFFILTGLSAFAETPSELTIRNLGTIEAALGFTPYYTKIPLRPMKVAVFDQDFTGYKKEVGHALPAATVYHQGPLAAPAAPAGEETISHGTMMAEMVTALMTESGSASQWSPELHLYNVYGYSDFKAAVEDAIAEKMDVILDSGVWEYGGNFDGRGFLDSLVSRATGAGIIWVNAAGNFARTTYNQSIVTDGDHWVRLPDTGSSLELICDSQNNPTGKCALRLVLSWNDFKDDVARGTSKDLDVFLMDEKMNVIASSQLKQTEGPDAPAGFSLYPREIIETILKPGTYFVRVKNQSLNFGVQDRMRVTVSGDFLSLNYGDPAESLSNPADQPQVITVGASDSELSSMSMKMGKPEVLAPSSVILGNGDEYRGSSNAAAFVAAGMALLKSLVPDGSKEDLLKLTSGLTGVSLEAGLPSTTLGFKGTGPGGCFKSATGSDLGNWPRDFYDGVIVDTTQGQKLMTRYDPIILTGGETRTKAGDAVVGNASGYHVVPRDKVTASKSGQMEAFQVPLDLGLCGVKTPVVYGSGLAGVMRPFHLPPIN